ncbi:MAG TPA: hypothetical protein VK213_04045 [Bacteroidales bacterium]|nr:hypothetical protein [Bacteroidales bacterium]
MGKRALIIIFLFLSVAIIVPGYFLFGKKNRVPGDPYSAIPATASIVIETIDLRSFVNSLVSGQGIFAEISNVEEFSEFSGRLKRIADYLNKPEFSDIFTTEKSSVISFIAPPGGKIRPLLSMPVDASLRDIKHSLTTSGIKEISETEFEDNKILTFKYSEKDTLFITLKSGLLLVSNSGVLVSRAFTALADNIDVRSMPGFSRILMASGDNTNKIFIIYNNFAGVLKPLLSSAIADTEQKIKSVASAGGGDFFLSNEGFIITGYSETSGVSDYFARFKNVRQGQFHAFRILPKITAMFESVLYNPDPKPATASGNSKILAGKMQNYISEEITKAVIDIKENSINNNTLIVYELTNRDMAEQAFLENTANDRTVMLFEPDKNLKIPVYRLTFSGFANELAPGFAGATSDSLFAFYENFLITGSSYLSIARVIYDNLNNNTLANDITYREFESSFPSKSGYFLYFVPSRIINYMDGILNDDLIKSLKKNKSNLNKIQAAGYQLSSSNGMIYNSLAVKYKESASDESVTEWQTLLDTVPVSKPFFFTNHLTGATEIFIQDARNNVYLINAAGRILWKVTLREKIEGSVFMIDFYKNGKLQLLFNGKSYLHILDRNGRYVENYPLRLKSPATAGLALFDYENNRNYRIIIPGEDRLLYAFDKSGNSVKGWKQFRTSGIVTSQATYYKVSGKDYIVISDDQAIYLLDRYGSKRVITKEPVIKASGSMIRLTEGIETYLTCTSPDGTIQKIYFDGRVVKNSFAKFSPDHFFDVSDINADGDDEYIYVDAGKISLYAKDSTDIFSTDIGSADLGNPVTFSFSYNDKKIGIFDSGKKLIYLIDRQGEMVSGFPVRGVSMFSIGRLADKNSWNLIVGGQDHFLYNYKIDTGT